MSETNITNLNEKKGKLAAENERLKRENVSLKSEKDSLYNKNRANVDARTKVKDEKSKATTILAVAAIAGFILFAALVGKGIIQTIIAILALLGGAAVGYLQFKKIKEVKPECDRLDSELSEYDAAVSDLDKKMNENNAAIAKNTEALALVDIEIKADAIQNAGCICVYTSHRFYKGHIPLHPVKNSEVVCTEGIVNIDGMQVGVVRPPFAIFKVKPGTHVVTTEVPFFKSAGDFTDSIKHGGSSKIYDPKKTFTTYPEQITIKNGQTVVLFVQMAYRSKTTGEEYVNYENIPFIEQYSSVAEFLRDTNQANMKLPEIPVLPE